MLHKRIFLMAFASLLAFSQAGCRLNPPGYRAWVYGDNRLYAESPVAILTHPQPPLTQADLDGDSRLEMLSIENGRATIRRESGLLWQSPDRWQVVQAQVADLNNDSLPEASLLVWRQFQPWPVDIFLPAGGRIQSFHNPAGFSCHLILIGWKDGQYRERWAGSALAQPLRAFAAADLDGDGWQELAALESDYTDQPSAPARALTAWKWNGFGFTLLSRVKGAFEEIGVNGGTLITR